MVIEASDRIGMGVTLIAYRFDGTYIFLRFDRKDSHWRLRAGCVGAGGQQNELDRSN
ncbi:uncharacterized protein METZ01_LOCUS377938 [marine metagenome]|uniref:Uncharacterized protein n=1 Tax=marine metagenome TaxID=408172 RepID=A0A382TSP8_9ZZZZ